MKKPKNAPVSVRDVAKAAGISKSAASYALRNDPNTSKKTRERVWRIAKKLGYSRDPELDVWMTKVRGSKTKGLLTIAWLNTHTTPSFRDHSFLSPYLEGAESRCFELGYKLEEIWLRQPGLTQKGISRILYHRGIDGLIVGHPTGHLSIDFNRLAAVCLEGSLLIPRLHRVCTNLTYNLTLAIRSVRRLGYQRIGVCLTDQVDQFSHHLIRSTLHYLGSATPDNNLVEPLFHPNVGGEGAKGPQVSKWIKKTKPDVVICHDNRMLQWIKELGHKVPEEIALVHLALDDDVLDWAGIYSNRRIIGRTAAELVISQIQNRQVGVPEVAWEILLTGAWRNGWTLRSPKDERAPAARAIT
jgi:LacI family transcriptional regulator